MLHLLRAPLHGCQGVLHQLPFVTPERGGGYRAGVHERLGKHSDALDDYDRAISLDGSFAEAIHAR